MEQFFPRSLSEPFEMITLTGKRLADQDRCMLITNARLADQDRCIMMTHASNIVGHHDRYALEGSHGMVEKAPTMEIVVLTQERFHKQ